MRWERSIFFLCGQKCNGFSETQMTESRLHFHPVSGGEKMSVSVVPLDNKYAYKCNTVGKLGANWSPGPTSPGPSVVLQAQQNRYWG